MRRPGTVLPHRCIYQPEGYNEPVDRDVYIIRGTSASTARRFRARVTKRLQIFARAFRDSATTVPLKIPLYTARFN